MISTLQKKTRNETTTPFSIFLSIYWSKEHTDTKLMWPPNRRKDKSFLCTTVLFMRTLFYFF